MKKPGVLEIPPEDELLLVCKSGDNERVQELLDFGVNPNHFTEHDSFISVACRAANHVALSKLLRAGAKCSRPMLADAILGGNPRCSDKVLDELHYDGFQIDIDIEASQLLLRRGFAAKLTIPMFEWLKKQGVDLTVRSAHGSTLAELAYRDRATHDLVEYLRQYEPSKL